LIEFYELAKNKMGFYRKSLIRLLLTFVIFSISNCTVGKFPVVRPSVDIAREETARMKAQKYFIDARDYERRGLDKSAEKYYELAYSLDPSSKILRQQVVRKYVESGKYSQALLVVKENRKNEDLDEEEKRLVSTIYLKMGEFSKAAEVLESIKEKSDEEIYSLGLIYESTKDFKRALQCYGDFYKRKPEAVQIGFKIGKILINEKRYEEAESLYYEMKEQDSKNPDIFSSLGMTLILKGDTVSGMEYFDSALVLDSVHEESLRSMAQVFIGRNEFPQAIDCYEKLYAESLYGEVYGRTLAMLYYYDKQFDKASTLLKELLIESIDDFELHFYMGLVYSATDQTDKARIELEKTLALQNGYEDAWKELCYMFVRKKDYEQAMEIADRFLKRFPEAASAWRLKGFVSNLKKEYKDAVEMLEQALKIDKNNPQIWYEYGSSLERIKEFDKAVNAFRKVLSLKPKDPAASNYLGYMWAEKGIMLDSAKILLQDALEQEPDNGAFLDSYAWIFYQMDEIDSAHFYMNRALEFIQDDPVIFSHLGDIFVKLNDFEAALDAFQKSLLLNSDEEDIIKKKIEEINLKLQNPESEK